MKKIYLACPYSHPDENVQEIRFLMVNKKTAELMIGGYIVFSPISHSVLIGKIMEIRQFPNARSYKFWMKQDLSYIQDWADEVWVYGIDGWIESPGVQREIREAWRNDIPVKLLKVGEYESNIHTSRREKADKLSGCETECEDCTCGSDEVEEEIYETATNVP